MAFSIETAPELAAQAGKGNWNAVQRLFLDIIGWIYPRPWNPVVSLANRKPTAGEILFDIVMDYQVTLPLNMEGSYGGCRTLPTADAVFGLYKRAGAGAAFEQFGIATIDTNGLSSFVGGFITFEIGDVFSFVAPDPQDATLEGLYFSFLGRRT
jgi:hypothetical protein